MVPLFCASVTASSFSLLIDDEGERSAAQRCSWGSSVSPSGWACSRGFYVRLGPRREIRAPEDGGGVGLSSGYRVEIVGRAADKGKNLILTGFPEKRGGSDPGIELDPMPVWRMDEFSTVL
ncbi:hypothetical protein BT93_A1752 [Corymbia citriodora subsp. variegata]|nr:hypothetical protein BT93_A1752 [Corymbia citriodora subsp. variegata]